MKTKTINYKLLSVVLDIFIIFIGFTTDVNTYCSSIEKIFLNIGETKKLDTPLDISVSRKGIIDILEQSNFYMITGLKPGLVMITTSTSEEGVVKKYLIEVKDLKLKQFNNKGVSSSNYSRICSLSNVSCNKNLNSISGVTDSIEVWKEVKKYCIDNGCEFNLKLSQSSFFNLIKSLEEKLSSMYQVKYVDQNIYIVSDCKESSSYNNENDTKKNVDTIKSRSLDSKKFINYITNNFIENYNIPVVCQQSFNQYYVTANIVLLEEGFIKDYKINLENLIKTDYTVFSNFINSHLFTQKIHLIGEPSLYMNVNHKASIHSGGEFQYKKGSSIILDNSKEDKDWKQTGIKIDLEILQEFSQSVKMNVSLALITKDSSDSSDTNLHSNSLTSQIKIPLRETSLIGTTDVVFKSSKKNGGFLFKYVPILSSFLAQNSSTKTNNKLFLWLTVKPSLSEEGFRTEIIR